MAAIYRKYRSQTFDEIIGQQNVVAILKNQLITNTLPHAILFTGPRGTGKTSLARIVAKSLNCLKRKDDANPCDNIDPCVNCLAISNGIFEDLIEIDAASNRGIEEIRTLKENINLLPLRSTHKIYIIDEAHMLTREAFNALLKVLEEPPKHVVFMLCTTEVAKVLPTITSRCEKLELTLATSDILMTKLKFICLKEGVEIDDGGLGVLIELAGGSFRDSESLLDKVFSSVAREDNKKINEASVRLLLGIPSSEAILSVIQGLQMKSTSKAMSSLEDLSSLSPIDFVKMLLSELTKDFEKNNEIIKLALKMDHEIKLSQFGYVIIKSNIVEWCDVAVMKNEAVVVSSNNNQPKLSRQVEVPHINVVSTPIKPSVISVDTKDFNSAWKSMIEMIAVKNKPLKFILNASKASASGNTITLVVAIKLHKDLLEKKTAKDLISEAYQKLFNDLPIINVYLTGEVQQKPNESKDDLDLESIFNS